MILFDRYETIEDVLVHMHLHQWFGWTDAGNKIYKNLEIYEVLGVTHPKPSEQELVDALAAQQAAYDALEYTRQRKNVYPSVQDQLDMQYHDAVDSTTTWADTIAAVKSKYPKPG